MRRHSEVNEGASVVGCGLEPQKVKKKRGSACGRRQKSTNEVRSGGEWARLSVVSKKIGGDSVKFLQKKQQHITEEEPEMQNSARERFKREAEDGKWRGCNFETKLGREKTHTHNGCSRKMREEGSLKKRTVTIATSSRKA